MRTKKLRLLAALLCAVLTATLISAVLPVSAAAEGEWTVYQKASGYPAEGDDLDAVYPLVAGYQYTDDGFSVFRPDWTDMMPFVTVTTKEPVDLKKGFFVRFRIAEYSYDVATTPTSGSVSPSIRALPRRTAPSPARSSRAVFVTAAALFP
jgi:hypothetical protein